MAKSSIYVLILFFLSHLNANFLADNELENDGWRNNPRFNNNHDDEINLHHHHEDPLTSSSSESLMIQTNSGLVRGISQTIPTGETVKAFLGVRFIFSSSLFIYIPKWCVYIIDPLRETTVGGSPIQETDPYRSLARCL